MNPDWDDMKQEWDEWARARGRVFDPNTLMERDEYGRYFDPVHNPKPEFGMPEGVWDGLAGEWVEPEVFDPVDGSYSPDKDEADGLSPDAIRDEFNRAISGPPYTILSASAPASAVPGAIWYDTSTRNKFGISGVDGSLGKATISMFQRYMKDTA